MGNSIVIKRTSNVLALDNSVKYMLAQCKAVQKELTIARASKDIDKIREIAPRLEKMRQIMLNEAHTRAKMTYNL